MIAVYIIIGVLAGVAIGYLLLKNSVLANSITKDELEKRYILRELYVEKINNLAEEEKKFINANSKITELTTENGVLKNQQKELTDKLANFNKEIQDLHTLSKEQFRNLANEILEEKSKKFSDLNKEKMDAILKPLGEKVVEFRQKVEEESKERNTLKGVIQNLMDMSKKMNEETINLTKALKGDSKVQGDWGEMILENILESSGLRKGGEYLVQESIATGTGKNLRPDIIISYPDGRKLIIDAKVSLTAYTRYVNAQIPEEQQTALKEHILSVQKHINELSEQNYHKYVPSLDFVMMFVPIEFSLLLALQNNPELWNYAYKKGVLLIGPTNLVAALKLIDDLWKREQQNKNAQDIADRGALLYEKFVGFVENLSDIGVSIDKAKTSYDKAYGQLKDGRGNLIEQAEKLKEMGVKTKKNLPSNLLPNQENNPGE